MNQDPLSEALANVPSEDELSSEEEERDVEEARAQIARPGWSLGLP